MYTLDINFLSDRAAIESQGVERQPIADTQFLIYGGGVAVVALALVGGAFLVLTATYDGIQKEIAVLTAQETQLNNKLNSLKGQEDQLQAIRARTGQLLTLFVGNFPVNAVIDDIRKRTPISVQVNSINQTPGIADPKNPSLTSLSTIALEGKAENYNELNDFMLLLKASPLLNSEKTILLSSTLQQATADKNFTLVDFRIETTTTSKSPAELLPELQKSGADGLVARVNLLRQQGAIK